MKVASLLLFGLALTLGIGGFINASKPSYSPILTVVGSFALPAIFAWWGVTLWKKAAAKSKNQSPRGKSDG